MNSTPLDLAKGRRIAVAAVASCLFWSTIASGQLIWGEGGNGGSGTWDTTTANWWNGSENVTWTDGSAAVFSGTGGTVTLPNSPSFALTSVTFDSPGYTLQGGGIRPSGSTLTITTNQSATIGSNLNGSSIRLLVKEGPATLAVAGFNFNRLQVNSGEYLVSGSSNLFFSDVTIADAANAIVTLGRDFNNASIRSLSGGGASGGILQPNSLDRTVMLRIHQSGAFRGIIQDNGDGKLGLEISSSVSTITLAGANTYSGATSLSFSGTLVFSENGSALNTEVSVSSAGTLRLDNSATVLANRLSDSADVNVQNGLIELVGNSSAPVEEHLGTLRFSGAAFVNVTRSGTAATLLTFANASRQGRSTIDFGGNGRTKWNGMANDSTGILGAYATVGGEWATVGMDGRVEALKDYATDINAAGPNDHVKIIGGSTTVLTESAVRATLNLAVGNASTLDLGVANVLTLDDGGILSGSGPFSNGGSVNRIQGGTLRAGITELVVTNSKALAIDSTIAEGITGTGLTKSGAGTLTLTGINSYSGSTVINQGTLVVSSDANLGTGSEIHFNGGRLRAAQSFSSTKSVTNSNPYVGVIDTAGFDVTFSGTNSALSKIGAGTLTLSTASPGSVSVSQGTLALINQTSGDMTLQGGTLLASGTLSTLRVDSASTLDIGGSIPATLTTGSLAGQVLFGEPLTVRFGLGASAQDLWAITDPVDMFNSYPGVFLFDFQDLGGIAPGSDFTLMNATAAEIPLTPSIFAFAPSAIAAGWSGTFRVEPDSVHVTIASAPEPGSVALLLCGGILLGGRRRARSSQFQERQG